MLINRRSLLATGSMLAAYSMLPRLTFAQSGETLTIGTSVAPTSFDPHFHNSPANSSLAQHVYDRLVHVDELQKPVPGLAESWKIVDDLTWEFKLRPGVKFHNGDPLTPKDVIFSYERAQNVPNALFSFKTYLGDKTVEEIDELTIHIKTKAPNPIVPAELSTVSIVSASVGKDATTADYNSLKAMIGTGPFKMTSGQLGSQMQFVRNDDYWGEKPEWQNLVIKPIPNAAARSAGLLSGDCGIIEGVSPADVTLISGKSDLSVVKTVAYRFVFLSFDASRKESPFVKAKNGGPLQNVLLDKRVREAISLAIQRDGIAQRILENVAAPAGQMVPEGTNGYVPELVPPKADVARAKQLLAEAGLPDGFQLTLHGPTDRYLRDTAVCEAVAQMLTRIGITTRVETMPGSAFFPRLTRGGPEDGSQFSFWLSGASAASGDIMSQLKSLLHSVDPDRGFGSLNRGRYSNAEVDKAIEQGMITLDDKARQALFAKATTLAMQDHAFIPLYFPLNVWGLRKPLTYPGRTDERTLSIFVKG